MGIRVLQPTPVVPCPVALVAAGERCAVALWLLPARPRCGRYQRPKLRLRAWSVITGAECRRRGWWGAAGDGETDTTHGGQAGQRWEHLQKVLDSHRLCTASDHHSWCCGRWAALCLTLGPVLTPKMVWMPMRQSTITRPGLRLSTSQKKDEPRRVFPRPRHHAIPSG